MTTPDWKAIERDVILKLHLLRAAWEESASKDAEIHELIVRDLYLPALEQLAIFSSCVQIGEPEDVETERVN